LDRFFSSLANQTPKSLLNLPLWLLDPLPKPGEWVKDRKESTLEGAKQKTPAPLDLSIRGETGA
jgi:hypothetical protein